MSFPSEIANEFNSFFVNAGQNISENVSPSNRTPESFLHPTENPPPELGNINATHTVYKIL